MANIDVSDLLSDPDFVDPCILIHRVAVVNEFGENVTTETCVKTVGSVQPASGKVISRLPDSLRVANLRSFWIRAEIVADGDARYPDLIVFRGKRYQVQTVDDWENYGNGYCEGTCVAEKVTG